MAIHDDCWHALILLRLIHTVPSVYFVGNNVHIYAFYTSNASMNDREDGWFAIQTDLTPEQQMKSGEELNTGFRDWLVTSGNLRQVLDLVRDWLVIVGKHTTLSLLFTS